MMMRTLLSALLGLVLVAGAARADVALGPVNVVAQRDSIRVHIAANSPQLQALAVKAFSSHGLYYVAPASLAAHYDLRFTWTGGNSVRVDVTRGVGGAVIASDTVTGTSARNALLRAADLAVERTNGRGLRGFFASKIAFVAGSGSHKDIYISDLY